MKHFSLRYKIFALAFALFFVSHSMNQINSHTYTTGVDSFHYTCGCFGCWQSHLAIKCDSNNPYCFY